MSRISDKSLDLQNTSVLRFGKFLKSKRESKKINYVQMLK